MPRRQKRTVRQTAVQKDVFGSESFFIIPKGWGPTNDWRDWFGESKVFVFWKNVKFTRGKK